MMVATNAFRITVSTDKQTTQSSSYQTNLHFKQAALPTFDSLCVKSGLCEKRIKFDDNVIFERKSTHLFNIEPTTWSRHRNTCGNFH